MYANLQTFEKHKVAWVVIPKAGCTSIKWALRHCRGSWFGPEPSDKFGKAFHDWFGYTRVPVSELKRIRRFYDGWTWFTVVRDPFARFTSLYANITRTQNWQGPECANISQFAEGFADSWWRKNVHGKPQTEIIGHDLSIYDHIGHTEDMAAVFAFLQKAFGQDIEYEHLSQSEHREGLSDADKRVLLPVFAYDFEVLPYESGVPT